MDELEKLKEKWPSPFVKRKDIEKFSFGIINRATIASADSRGNGIENRFYIGRKVAYPIESVLKWLKEKVETSK